MRKLVKMLTDKTLRKKARKEVFDSEKSLSEFSCTEDDKEHLRNQNSVKGP
jgi:hypothetical protein